jgi:hypothetical protein
MINFVTQWWYDHWQAARTDPERGSVTMENVIWAIAVIGIAAIVVGAITLYVTNHSNGLLGP